MEAAEIIGKGGEIDWHTCSQKKVVGKQEEEEGDGWG